MNVLLFGIIAEKAGTAQLTLSAKSTHDLRRALEERVVGMAQLNYAIAVDRRIVHGDLALTGMEEVAVLPPFAGG